MLIIAAIGLLWVAWDRDWGNIRTKTEEVWEIIEPIFKDIWKWLGKAWRWTIDTAGALGTGSKTPPGSRSGMTSRNG